MTAEVKTGPKDVFLHLLSILGLYIAVVSFGSLLFQIINIYFPDLLDYGYLRFTKNSLKWPLSVLVVVFPLYVWLTYYIQKDIYENPEKRELKVRKWLLYFTLSLAAVVMTGDLITLIYTYLNGEITARFILKILTVFAIAGSVFFYYMWHLKKETIAIKDPRMSIFVYAVLLIVLAFVVFGFYIAGSPQSARRERFDAKRVNDLQILQSNVVEYWKLKGGLPESLEDLRDSISGFTPPGDPETNGPYSYTIKGELSFELCADFDTESQVVDGARPQPAYDPYDYSYDSDYWDHGKGLVCFLRTIDPQRHPPKTIKPATID